MKYLCLLIALCALPSYLFSQENTKDYSEAFTLIKNWLDAQKDYEKLPAITVSIVKDQEVLWASSFGMANAENEVEASTKTTFSICSISKLFTSVAIMKLYDEGKLRLDDGIGDLLPWYDLKQQFSESGPITVRTLLSHSSGLPRENTYSHWNSPDFHFPSKAQIKEKLSDQKTLYPASTYYQYSNLAFTLLGYIVEEVSGQSFDSYVMEHILTPLNLSDTKTNMPEDLHGNTLAIGYSQLLRNGTRQEVNLFDAKGVAPAAGFSSNVEDLSKFASWQFRLLDTTAVEILRPSTLKHMQNIHWTDSNWYNTRGLGFGIYKGPDGGKWVGHSGYCPGYQTVLNLHPKSKLAYVVMINANGVDPYKYVYGMHNILKKVKRKKGDSKDADFLDLNAYTGRYEMQAFKEVFITTWEGKLALVRFPSNNPARAMTLYKHIATDKFQRIRDNGELGEVLSFKRNENNVVYQMVLHDNYVYAKVEP